MKMLTAFLLITMLSGCAASAGGSCPPADEWLEPSSGPFNCQTMAQPGLADWTQEFQFGGP